MALSRAAAKHQAAKHRPTPAHWTESFPTWIWLLVLAAWVLLFYGHTLEAPFVYDDLDQILRNPNLADWHNVFTRFLQAPVDFTSELLSSNSAGASYRPLYWISLSLDRHLWGLNPIGYHLTSLLLYAFNGALLLQLLRRLRLAILPALATSLLWLSLPINSESIAWISARAYPLCLFFLLLSLLATLRYLSSRQPVALIAASLAAFAALLSHESGILILPFAALVIWLNFRSSHEPLPSRATIVVLGADLIAIALLFTLRIALHVRSAVGPSAPLTFAATLCKYVGWTILPLRMSVERSTSLPSSAPLVLALAWIVLLSLIALTLLLAKKLPTAAFGLSWLLLALAPFSGIVFLYQGMAERFCFIASIGLAIAIVSLVCSPKLPLRNVLLCAAALWAAWGVYRLETRLADWNSPAQLFRSSLEATPASPTLWFNLGFTLREANQLSDAAEAYQNAARLRPSYERAFASLGETYARMGQLDRSAGAYRQALALKPNDAPTLLNLAVVLHQSGHDDQAEREFRRTIELAPDDASAYTDLGVLLYQQGHIDEAELMFIQAIRHNATDPTPYSNLALLYRQSGHPALALSLYQKLLTIRPNDPEVLANIQRLQQKR